MTLVSHQAMATLYSGREAVEIAGVTYRQADYWIRTGVVAPEVAAHGSGSRRRFTLDDVMLLAVGGVLAPFGHVHALKRLAESDLMATTDRLYLGGAVGNHRWATHPSMLMRADVAAEVVIFVDLARIRARVAEAADALVATRSDRDALEASR